MVIELDNFCVPEKIQEILLCYQEHPEEWKAPCSHPLYSVKRTETAYVINEDIIFTLPKGCALEMIYCALRRREILGGGSLYVEMPFDVTVEPGATVVFRCEATTVIPCWPGIDAKAIDGMIEIKNTTNETLCLGEGQPIARIG